MMEALGDGLCPRLLGREACAMRGPDESCWQAKGRIACMRYKRA